MEEESDLKAAAKHFYWARLFGLFIAVAFFFISNTYSSMQASKIIILSFLVFAIWQMILFLYFLKRHDVVVGYGRYSGEFAHKSTKGEAFVQFLINLFFIIILILFFFFLN
jgi:hypothetical protein